MCSMGIDIVCVVCSEHDSDGGSALLIIAIVIVIVIVIAKSQGNDQLCLLEKIVELQFAPTQ